VWVKVSESMRSILEGFTLADLVERARIGHLDAEGRPLGINAGDSGVSPGITEEE